MPAAFAAMWVVQIAGVVFSFGIPVFIVQLWNSSVGASAFVAAGAFTAPQHRFAVALSLAVLFSGALLVLMFILATDGTLGQDTPAWWVIANAIVSLVAAVTTCYQFHQDEVLGAAL